MHIITRKRLNEFAANHPNAKPGLIHWYRTLKPMTIRSFAELRTRFPSADQVGKRLAGEPGATLVKRVEMRGGGNRGEQPVYDADRNGKI
mgnify:CR=1 FL=1